MKRAMLGAAMAAMLVNSACTPVLKEVRYPGGYAGYLLDKRTFNSSASKQLLLFRATLVLAMAADMGQVTVNAQDADAFAKLLASAATEINYAAADVYGSGLCRATGANGKPTPVATPPAGEADVNANKADDAGCIGFSENFESNIPRIEGRIIKVMLAALPTDKARKFLDNISSGNVLGAALAAIGAVAKSLGGLHYAFGRYRSGLETVAGSMTSCQPGKSEFDPMTETVWDAAACLGLSEDSLLDNPDEAKREKLKSPNVKVNERVMFMLMRGIAADCVSLPYTGKGSDLAASQELRTKTCNGIGYAPTARPYRIKTEGYTPEVNTGEKTAPYTGKFPAPRGGAATEPPATTEGSSGGTTSTISH